MPSQSHFKSYRWGALSLSLALVLLPARQVAWSSPSQDREGLNRLAQAQADPGREMKAFRDGRDALAEEKWARAAERFNDYVSDYPQSKNVDAALYWLAFALVKQGKYLEADRALKKLLAGFPGSSWAEDGRAMQVEIAPHVGDAALVSEKAKGADNDEAKLVALRSMFTSDPEQATTLAADIFKPGAKADRSFKEAALTLVGRYGGSRSTTLLAGVARDESDERLSKAAIFWLGKRSDDGALEVLTEVAQQTESVEIASAAVAAILQHGSQRAIGALGDISRGAKSAEARQQASSLLGVGPSAGRAGTKGVWLLVRDSNQLLLVPNERVVRLTGAGNLKFKRDGRLIEFPPGHTLTINGATVFKENDVRRGETAVVVGGEMVHRERVVRENEVVQIAGESPKSRWELSLGPAGDSAVFGHGDWLTINGEFTVNTTDPKTFLLYAQPAGGLRIRR